MRQVILAGCALTVAAAACGSSGPSGGGAAGHLSLVSGDLQSVAPRAGASAPLVVRLTDQDGHPLPGAPVAWRIIQGRGALTPSGFTDSAGGATVSFTSDSLAGVVRVVARSAQAADSVTFTVTVRAGAPARLRRGSGEGQSACGGTTLVLPLTALVTDQYGNPTSGAWVRWTVSAGGGRVSADSTPVDAGGDSHVAFTLGPADSATHQVTASGSFTTAPAVFHATARRCFTVLGGGNNEGQRYTSDIWLARGYGYTGTWGFRGAAGNVVDIWRLGAGGAPALAGQLTVAPGITTVSDLQVTPDSNYLVLTGEYGADAGLYLYGLADPLSPSFLARVLVTGSGTHGLHTGTVAAVGGGVYAFTARDPRGAALLIFRIQPDSTTKLVLVDSLAMPENYGIHDTYVRDGLLFVENWDSGLWIYDIGGGGHGGAVTAPVLLGTVVTGAAADGSVPAGSVHNAWWFHNPVTNEKKYVFVGQEGPGTVGVASAGDIHVVDISDLTHPVEVAQYHMAGAGTHNFWVDEPRQVLYAAYYNGGVVALDVSGTLSGDLAAREIARIAPGGAGNTYVWGVMLYGGHLYAADMVSGFWELGLP